MSKVRFYIFRHGTTLLNEEDKYRGWSNDDTADLDEDGIKQAEKAGRFFAKREDTYGPIICSDLNRTQHSAALVARKLSIPVINTDSRLRPLNTGDLTGESKAEVSIDPYLKDKNKRIPGGESINEFEHRQDEFSHSLFEEIKANPDSRPILVAHLSTVIYWRNRHMKSLDLDYATDKEDFIHPGGVVAVMDDGSVVPLLGANDKAEKAE